MTATLATCQDPTVCRRPVPDLGDTDPGQSPGPRTQTDRGPALADQANLKSNCASNQSSDFVYLIQVHDFPGKRKGPTLMESRSLGADPGETGLRLLSSHNVYYDKSNMRFRRLVSRCRRHEMLVMPDEMLVTRTTCGHGWLLPTISLAPMGIRTPILRLTGAGRDPLWHL
jgi:hypothetical protein